MVVLIKFCLVFFLFFTFTYARENPFFPIVKDGSNIGFLKKHRQLIYKYGIIHIDNDSMVVKILTKDMLYKKFILSKPYRIVLDFIKKSDMKTKYIKNLDSIFKSIVVGSHKKYYRVVIELSRTYSYKIKIISGGYIVKVIPNG